MIGMDKQTLYNWSSKESFDLQEKIAEDNQESLEKLMFDRRNNPMKYLPKLNRYHGYNMSGVRENTSNRNILSIEDLKDKVLELSQNQTVIEQIEPPKS